MTQQPAQPLQTTDDLIREGVDLEQEINLKSDRLKEIKLHLAGQAEFKGKSKKTGSLCGAGFLVKVSLRDNTTWDQEALEALREAMGNEAFFKVFKWEFKPESKKKLDAFKEYASPEFADLLNKAMTVTPAAPSVKFEDMEGMVETC